jgi:hypothetical protein
MHLDTIRTTKNGKQYVCHLLRETYREKGKVKHRTIANLSHCPGEEIEAIRLALKHKDALTELVSLKDHLEIQQGLSVGAVFVLHSVAKRLGIVQALGNTRQGKRALWQVLARVIDQGSRLSAVRLAGVHAACDVLGLEPFNEDDLYENLDWLVDKQAKIERLRLSGWLQVSVADRTLSLQQDTEALADESKLDGCYCLKTDLAAEVATKERVHERYKSLSEVEWAFRTCKTAHLEARPIYVRKESRTRGHVFVVMLAYMIVAELARCWHALDLTVEEGIQELSTLCMTEVTIDGKTRINEVPTPRASIKRLLQAADIRMPKAFPYTGATVSSRKKLTEERKPR